MMGVGWPRAATEEMMTRRGEAVSRVSEEMLIRIVWWIQSNWIGRLDSLIVHCWPGACTTCLWIVDWIQSSRL